MCGLQRRKESKGRKAGNREKKTAQVMRGKEEVKERGREKGEG